MTLLIWRINLIMKLNSSGFAVVWTVLILWGLSTSKVMAQVDTTAYSLSLDTVTVSSKRYTSKLRGNANVTVRWNMDMLHDLPKILGNADPVHYAQMLPGVQTCSEYDSGLYIQGCDNAHNLVSIEHVPIYNASHLFGFFSVFNATHFPQMHFSKTVQNSSVSNHLGGVVSMQLPDSLLQRSSGEYAIGPMSSQGTLRVPVNKKSSLFLSLRAAYLNLLYGKWLELDGNRMKYDFSDYNVTYLYVPDKKNKVKADFYMGYDNASFHEGSYHARNKLKWHNEKLSLSWNHSWQEGVELDQTLYYTSYHNCYDLGQAGLEFVLPSSITDFAYKGIFRYRQWQLGTDVVFHRIQPQNPQVNGSYHAVVSSQPKQGVWETALFADYARRFSDEWSMEMGTRFTYFRGEDARYTSLDPMLTLAYSSNGWGNLSLNFRMQHQYLFQTGFSSMGLPTEFWFAAGREYKPQSSRGISLTYDIPLFQNAYKLYVEGYYKRLYNQVEYKGTIFDFVNSVYSLDDSLLKGNGENYGINVMLNKQTGNLTGWISYTWGRSFRRFSEIGYLKRYPSNHERIHELNAMATYQINPNWSIGTSVVFASGTPFTAPKHLYWFANHIVAEYGEHNASRLDPYFRMDLSMNYNLIKKGKKELGVNISFYNVTSHSNELYHRFSFNEEEKTYKYKPVRFVLNILPSFSVYHKF